MRAQETVCVVSAMLAVPVVAFAETDTSPKSDAIAATGMNCPMMGDTGAMQKEIDAMMQDMNAMMSSATDPSMKEQMQKMHDQMGDMMNNMQQMGSGMMRGRMMQGKQDSSGAPPTTPPASSDGHKADPPGK